MVEGCVPTGIYQIWIRIVGEQYGSTIHIVSLGGLNQGCAAFIIPDVNAGIIF